MPDRSVSPVIKDPVDLNLQLKPCDRFTLDNGVPVYSVNAGAQEVTMVELVFFAGNSFERKNIVAATTNFMLKNGTTSKTAFEINEQFEYYGAYLNRTCVNETATVSLHCLNKHLREILPVVAEVISESVFREEELAIYKQNQKQRLEVNLKKCDFVANRFIDEYLYGRNHPYGKYTSAADFDALHRDEILEFFKTFYVNGQCLIFVAGKLPADMQEQLNSVFGRLPLKSGPIPSIAHKIVPAKKKKHRVINDEHGVQGAIRVARDFPNRHHPDFVKCQVLNNIFGGFFGSRLMGNIREDKGYTYGIHSYFQNHIQQSAWMVSTEAGREVCEPTIKEIYNEMEDLREELVDEEELMLVRNYMMGTILADLDGPFQMIARWKNYILNGITEDYFYKSIETIKTITAEELKSLAEKYLVPDDFYELVVV
ncbi:insulinase family protein [Segetibacter sp. 3557_3]|uniref:M16 family metallopeptidase n=1 Tax=Segetibacter sp. 3557_3 TaxID=2547429 RepID=UPI001058E0EA|nr:pitrilysin family protein [Segetibacter sp. 3557_3]TDH18370.1 insulinase family protein [Segetibacter sp. 3557_3]